MNLHVGTAGTAAGAAGLSQEAITWAAKRGISRATLERLNVGTGTGFFPELERKQRALMFQYRGGWKARAFPEKAFVSKPGLKQSFWNEEIVLAANPGTIYITEGELDACALVEAGIPVEQVLSVPGGASVTNGEPRGHAYADDAIEAGLNRARRIVWCGDNDEAGLALRADMVAIFGPARFLFVDWPDGCKDAGDVLVAKGADFLHTLITTEAREWPIDDVYRLNQLPELPPMTLWDPGFPEWDGKIMLAPRTLSVFTGHPGHGKTHLSAQIWFNILKRYDLTACVASFETRPKPHLRRILRTLHSGYLERDMAEQQKQKADAWINEHYLFLQHRDQRPTLEWFLEKCEAAVVRHGARIVQIDPWNRIEASRDPRETETEYIGRCLRTLHAFANDMNCHVQILAHPAKMESGRRGYPPLLEDISGSKNWDNMADQGFTIHRPKVFDNGMRQTSAEFYYRKARFDELGYPCELKLRFDLAKNRFVSSDGPG